MLYELLKYRPLEIMQCWRFDDISPRRAYLPPWGNMPAIFTTAGEVDVFTAEDGRYRQARWRQRSMLGELEIFESRHYICSGQPSAMRLLPACRKRISLADAG